LAIFTALVVVMSTSKRISRRGAFDIGSGATKLQVSDVDSETGTIRETFFGQERPVAFGAAWLRSEDSNLGPEIQEKGLQTIKDFLDIGNSFGTEHYSAIATEVFRKASNGQLFLDKIRSLGITVSVVSQELEAELGYATALAVGGISPSLGCIAWDSGGASFQITSRQSGDNKEKEGLHMYMGALGAGVATAALIETVRGQKLSDVASPNPVSSDEANRLVQELQGRIPPAPAWLQGAEEVIAIGGPNSIFRLVCDVLTALRDEGSDQRALSPDRDSEHTDCVNYNKGTAVHTFTAENVKAALTECLDRSDEYLMKYVSFEHADPPTIIAPKLALLYAVMTHARIGKVKALSAIGSCGGLLITESQWV
jgi:hypothetical protein